MPKGKMESSDILGLRWETKEDTSYGVHVVDLLPTTPISKRKFNAAYTDVVTSLAKDDPAISLLAQQLSDEVDGIGIISALKILAGCGMLINEEMGKR